MCVIWTSKKPFLISQVEFYKKTFKRVTDYNSFDAVGGKVLPPIFTVWSKQYDPENPLMINCSLGKVSSTLIFKIIRTSRLVLTRSRRYSNLFLTEFILTWPIIILNEFLFLTCLSPSILSLKRGLQTGLSQSREVSEVVSCIILKDKGFSLRRSAKYQKIQMKSNLPFYV